MKVSSQVKYHNRTEAVTAAEAEELERARRRAHTPRLRFAFSCYREFIEFSMENLNIYAFFLFYIVFLHPGLCIFLSREKLYKSIRRVVS